MWMRGGTSKGGYFLREHLPDNREERDRVLLDIMGSPDLRQIDGMGGAKSLTSKVAIVTQSKREGIDVDYLFLQIGVDQPLVSDGQNCGNILAGVGPFAIERGLVAPEDGESRVSIFMENTGQVAIATIQTPNKRVIYDGSTAIDGVPGTAAPVTLEFEDTAGSTCGALLPSGSACDKIDDIELTMIDNGMPCVVMCAADFGLTGTETPDELDNNLHLKKRLESIRLQCGTHMNLGDVSEKTIPKMSLVSAPTSGGVISTRTFIPHTCHVSIGVLGAVSVATACLIEGAPANNLASIPAGDIKTLSVEHPSGETSVVTTMLGDTVKSAAILRTANKLMDGFVFP